MTDGTTAISFAYNADGQRVSKTVGGVTYNYVYVGSTLTDVTWGNNTLHFVYDALGASAVIYNGTTYYYLRNAQGDIVGIVDSAGTQVVGYTYDAWGNNLSTTGSMAATLGVDNPLRYRGYFYDTETGLYYLMSRYYNPTWGRFINADGYVSTGQGFVGNNMFAYCNNNPVSNVDLSGTKVYGVLGVSLSAAVGVSGSIGVMSIWDDKGNFADVYVGYYGGGTPNAGASLDLFMYSDAADIFEYVYGYSSNIGGSLAVVTGGVQIGSDSSGNPIYGSSISIGISALPVEGHGAIGYAGIMDLILYQGKAVPKDVTMDYFADLNPKIQINLQKNLNIKPGTKGISKSSGRGGGSRVMCTR